MPPVANRRMPARSAIAQVAETVVPASRLFAQRAASSRAPALAGLRAGSASRWRSASLIPMSTVPEMTPTKAGTAPPSRTAFAQRRAASRFAGGGRPCATTLVSSATRARRSRSAVATSSERRISSSIRRRSLPRPEAQRVRERWAKVRFGGLAEARLPTLGRLHVADVAVGESHQHRGPRAEPKLAHWLTGHADERQGPDPQPRLHREAIHSQRDCVGERPPRRPGNAEAGLRRRQRDDARLARQRRSHLGRGGWPG